jgi:hypothetical protein
MKSKFVNYHLSSGEMAVTFFYVVVGTPLILWLSLTHLYLAWWLWPMAAALPFLFTLYRERKDGRPLPSGFLAYMLLFVLQMLCLGYLVGPNTTLKNYPYLVAVPLCLVLLRRIVHKRTH